MLKDEVGVDGLSSSCVHPALAHLGEAPRVAGLLEHSHRHCVTGPVYYEAAAHVCARTFKMDCMCECVRANV